AATDPARVTRKDPGNPDICNIFTIHQGFSTPAQQADVAHKCRTAGWGCLDCKRLLADNIIAALAPMRERHAQLRAEPERVRAIRLERELGGKPAGLRTNILICIGSVLYTKLSMTMGGPTSDPTRVAAQIVTGVGFIGAGTILHARGAVVGLTSAATIWVVAA